jgi:hypothetical protein
MSDDPHEEGPVCDFCEIAVEVDETLEPIYVGEPPQPEPHCLREVVSSSRDARLLGKPIGIYQAIYQALHKCNDVQLKESNRVKEVRSVSGETHYSDLEYGSVPQSTVFETNTRNDKAGVTLKIHPKDVTCEPDAKVCDCCAEMFKNL